MIIAHVTLPQIQMEVQLIYAVAIFTIPLLTAIATAIVASYFKVRQAYEEACKAHNVSLDNSQTINQIKSSLNGSPLANSQSKSAYPEVNH